MAGQPLPPLRQQVLALKVVDLVECCQRIGLRSVGRKAELQHRVLDYLGELVPGASAALQPTTEQWKLARAASVVHEVYRASKGLPSASSLPAPAATAQPAASLPRLSPPRIANCTDALVRCICQSTVVRGGMVQCQDLSCSTWQHSDCMRLPPITTQAPATYRCELCRAALADPFWEPVEQLLPPAILPPVVGRPPMADQYGVHPTQCLERCFYLSDQQLRAAEAFPEAWRVQVGCLQLEDGVPCRYHWPRNVTLRANSIGMRPYARSLNVKMGINQRDDATSIAQYCIRGRNSVVVSAVDSGSYVLLLQRCRRRSAAEVQALMAPEESLEQAVARVRRQVAGGHGDDGFVVAHQVISLKDPLGGQRMQVAARFADASGLQAFDLDSFLSIAAHNRKWQDPTTMANSTVKQLQRDAFLQRILACLAASPDVTDVELDDQGLWRPSGSQGRWWSVAQGPEEVQAEMSLQAARGAPVQRKATPPGADGITVGGSETDEDEDEDEELRRAAAAVKPASGAALSSQKRRQMEEPEVISLLSSDEDEEPRATRPALATNGGPGRAAAGGDRGGVPRPGVAAAGRSPRQEELRAAAAAHMHAAPGAGVVSNSPLRIRLVPLPQQPAARALQRTQPQQVPQLPTGPHTHMRMGPPGQLQPQQPQQPQQQQPPPPQQHAAVCQPSAGVQHRPPSALGPMPHALWQDAVSALRAGVVASSPPELAPALAVAAQGISAATVAQDAAAAAVSVEPHAGVAIRACQHSTDANCSQQSPSVAQPLHPQLRPQSARVQHGSGSQPTGSQLSEQAQARLREEAAFLAQNPSVVEEVNDWLN